jgi:DNA-binding NarL/FixJ family response regulator
MRASTAAIDEALCGDSEGLFMTYKAKILIVDDRPIMREGLQNGLNRQDDLMVCGEAANVSEAMKQISICTPDLAILDLVMRNGNGLDLICDIAARHPSLPTLVFSDQPERLYARRALLAGAKGYIMKTEPIEKVVEAIRQVLAGHVYLSAAMASECLDGLTASKTASRDSPLEAFSDREMEIFGLLGEGLSTRRIAASLHISGSTVQTYFERLKLQLKVASLNDLRHHAILWKNGNPPTTVSNRAEETAIPG